jgi:pilus assembly protein CpaE
MVVGSQDPELDAVLRACGATLTTLPMSELAVLAQPSVKQPDLVVLDLRGHAGMPPGLTALKRQHAGTGVIIVAKTLDPDLILSAMRAGANECVAEPLTQGEIDAAITRIVARHDGPTASQAFAFVGVKGGVGATLVAVNVSAALARIATAGALFVDLHVSRGDAALYLGVDPRFTVADALENIHKLDEAFFRSLIVRAPSRLDLLAAPDGSGNVKLDGARVKTLLEFASKHYEFSVVDVPRTEPAALEALDSMKAIVVVTTQEMPAVRGARILADRLRQRYGKERVLIVLNRRDKLADIRQEDVEQALGAPIVETFPSDYRATIQSLNVGRPLVLDNHNALSASIEKFARSLAGLKTEKSDRPIKRGVWDSLVGRR